MPGQARSPLHMGHFTAKSNAGIQRYARANIYLIFHVYIRIYTRFTPSHYLRSRVARASILLVSCDVWVRASAVLGSQATVHASVTTVHTYGPLSLHTLSGQLYHTCTNEHMRACWCVHARLVCLACAGATSVAPPSPIAASHMNARARRQPP